MLRLLVCLVVFAHTAHAQVALLPLDAGAKLEVYGQPVASEVARALIAGQIDVVVVLPKMDVPDTAKLIVDGTITAGKGTAIELSLRVRDPKSGATVQTFQATSLSLETLDKTTAELAQKLLPVLRDKLAQLAKPVEPARPPPPLDPEPVAMPSVLVGVAPARSAGANVEPLRVALTESAPLWVLAHRRQAITTDAAALGAKTAAKTIAASKAERGVAFEILAFERSGDKIPLATARVRVRIADAGRVLFDRVVVTDTVVGDANMSAELLAARVAREVLAIVEPHARKVIAW